MSTAAGFPIQAQAADLANKNIEFIADSGAPTNGTSGTGAGFCGPGSTYTDTATGDEYLQIGTLASPTWSLMAGSRIGYIAEVVITSAQLKAIRATPITLVAAPGAGKVLQFNAGSGFLKYAGTNPFTGAQNLAVKYKDGTGVAVSGAITGAGFVDQSASEYQPIAQAAGAIYSKANSDNQPFVLHNTGAAEITGNAGADNTLLVKISYSIWTPGW